MNFDQNSNGKDSTWSQLTWKHDLETLLTWKHVSLKLSSRPNAEHMVNLTEYFQVVFPS